MCTYSHICLVASVFSLSIVIASVQLNSRMLTKHNANTSTQSTHSDVVLMCAYATTCDSVTPLPGEFVSQKNAIIEAPVMEFVAERCSIHSRG